jgi:hypothetical protein
VHRELYSRHDRMLWMRGSIPVQALNLSLLVSLVVGVAQQHLVVLMLLHGIALGPTHSSHE